MCEIRGTPFISFRQFVPPIRAICLGKVQVAFLQTWKWKEVFKKFYRVLPTDAVEVI